VVLQFMAILFQRLVGMGALLQLPLPPAQLVVLRLQYDCGRVWSPAPTVYPANCFRYSTHTGKSSGPLTGLASMESRPA